MGPRIVSVAPHSHILIKHTHTHTHVFQTLLQGGKEHEAYYATHDYTRRLICVDIPDPVKVTPLCDNDAAVSELGVDLCETETNVLRDLRGLQSLGGEDFEETPW